MSRCRVVVVLGTAANPPHHGHLQCLADGKAEAERQGYEVLWCTLAPAHDGYVEQKMRKKGLGYMRGVDRLKIVKLLLEGREGCEWFRMPDKMYGSALECGRKLRPGDDVKVAVVLGSDRAHQKWQRKDKHDAITIALARSAADRADLVSGYESDRKNDLVQSRFFYIAPSAGPSTSSTLIRHLFTQILTTDDPTPHVAALATHGYTPSMVDYLLRAKLSALTDVTGTF